MSSIVNKVRFMMHCSFLTTLWMYIQALDLCIHVIMVLNKQPQQLQH